MLPSIGLTGKKSPDFQQVILGRIISILYEPAGRTSFQDRRVLAVPASMRPPKEEMGEVKGEVGAVERRVTLSCATILRILSAVALALSMGVVTSRAVE